MEIKLVKAIPGDVLLLHDVQTRAFQPLLEKYLDYEKNPANEPINRLFEKIQYSSFFKMVVDQKCVGGIRIVARNNSYWISPIFVLPEFQGKGIAQQAICQVEEIFTKHNIWELQTILEEQGNCYLYEKLGYERTDFEQVVNDRMTLVGYRKIKN
ncbi:GNAT family N-acetyltransferase [Ureibacillus aquaedulcis]|uniref:GNAT family N-acetyltransferase n=1 Tax=Ureibacillus aquaedulcis TaxID=3058421 RepID=A0ABT8GTN5_9BACL|nr:GNAT family N-acetyltransferase [Ureibacillus sp. BA0131]MDN4494781.1 GNAT family N-acetyltransferase [Ureibacillus sp. BA0131]